MFYPVAAFKRSRRNLTALVVAALAGLSILVLVAVSDSASFDKSAPAQPREVTLTNTQIQGIGSRVLIPLGNVVVVSGERVLISFSGRDAAGNPSSGSVEGLVTTVVPGLGFWVRFPSLDLIKGAYPPSPVPPTVDSMTVTVGPLGA